MVSGWYGFRSPRWRSRPRVAAQVPVLDPARGGVDQDRVTVVIDPDRRDLWRTVCVYRADVREVRALEQACGYFGDAGHLCTSGSLG